MNKRNSSAYNRDVSKRKALRKRRIAEEVYWGGKDHRYYNNLHQYSKNKIHCSCPLCSEKARNNGKHVKTMQEIKEDLKFKESLSEL